MLIIIALAWGGYVLYLQARNRLRDRYTTRGGPDAARTMLYRWLARETGRHSSNAGRMLLVRGLDTVIVDEADSVLIDEAVTPLILQPQEKIRAWSKRYGSRQRLRMH